MRQTRTALLTVPIVLGVLAAISAALPRHSLTSSSIDDGLARITANLPFSMVNPEPVVAVN
jgi:hypothetical protein